MHPSHGHLSQQEVLLRPQLAPVLGWAWEGGPGHQRMREEKVTVQKQGTACVCSDLSPF